MTRKLYEIAADIVEAQASFAQMSPEALEQVLSRVFVTLQRMKMAEDGGFLLDQAKSPGQELVQEEVPERIDPRKSIQRDKVICLECQAEMRQLTAKHLGSHGLSLRGMCSGGKCLTLVIFCGTGWNSFGIGRWKAVNKERGVTAGCLPSHSSPTSYKA